MVMPDYGEGDIRSNPLTLMHEYWWIFGHDRLAWYFRRGTKISTCRALQSLDYAVDDGQLDGSPVGHGTRLAITAATMAPEARFVVYDVYDPDDNSSDEIILRAINRVLGLKAQGMANIVAINMSFSANTRSPYYGEYDSVCNTFGGAPNPYSAAFLQARYLGIAPVAISGNDGFSGGVNYPSCTPGAIRVGAVYDNDYSWAGWVFEDCTETSYGADRVMCISNSGSLLTVLAPGISWEEIPTGSGQWQPSVGTSYAAPYISGAVAVLKGNNAFPVDSVQQTIDRITAWGTPITDSRNQLTRPRLDIYSSLTD